MEPEQVMVINLSGRGDKDVAEVMRLMEAQGGAA
jgi:tryptophan synthase beta chain